MHDPDPRDDGTPSPFPDPERKEPDQPVPIEDPDDPDQSEKGGAG
ncbi:hypothetical protein [Pseudomonas sp. IC_126]|nr:hypothetical protein [Pseudomonas sp. IC_126]